MTIAYFGRSVRETCEIEIEIEIEITISTVTRLGTRKAGPGYW